MRPLRPVSVCLHYCALFNSCITILKPDVCPKFDLFQNIFTPSESDSYRQTTSVPTKIVSHDGTDVAIYATGPMAHLFHRTHEQHYIFHVMAYAASLGQYQLHLHPDHRYAKYGADPAIGVEMHVSASIVQEKSGSAAEVSSAGEKNGAATLFSGVLKLAILFLSIYTSRHLMSFS